MTGFRSAGNQSLLSFRTGFAVSGYSGYIPSNEAVPIPTKGGPNEEPPEALRDRSPARGYEEQAPLKPSASTEYAEKFKEDQMIRTHRRGGLQPSESFYESGMGAMNEEGNSPPQVPSKKFMATTSYVSGYVDPRARMRYSVVEGRISAMNETETKRKIMLGDRKSTSRALVTTYGAAYELLNAKQSDQASVAPESSAASQSLKVYAERRGAPDFASASQISFTQTGSSMYNTMYNLTNKSGKLLEMQTLRDPVQISDAADTKELFSTSAKYFRGRIPGYQGFLPENVHDSCRTALALEHSKDHLQTQSKKFGLFVLHNFSHHIPGYLGFQAQNPINAQAAPKFALEGRLGTTSEDFNYQVAAPETLEKTRQRRAAMKMFHPTRGRYQKDFSVSSEMLTFFTPGAEVESANGKTNAEGFYRISRPLEGLPRKIVPSATTESGYLFDTYTSRIG